MRFTDIKEHCPFHPNAKPMLYHVETTTKKCIQRFICGHKGCVHEWQVDLTKDMEVNYG